MTTTLVKRPARIPPPATDSDPIVIEAPPGRAQATPPGAGASMLMMPLMGGAGSVTVAITQKDRPIVAVAAFLALLGAISIGLIMVISQRSGRKSQQRESRERYLDYIESLRHRVRERIAAQRAQQAWCHPRDDQLLDISQDETRRWERRPQHGDFLTVRVGTGDVPLGAGLTLDADTGPLNEFDPVSLQAAQELQQRYAMLHEQPIVLPLALVGQVAVQGAPAARRALATSLVTQLATLHGPSDVSIAVIRSDDAADAWEWTKWLPHTLDPESYDGDVPSRRIGTSLASLEDQLAPELEARLDRHQRARGSAAAPPTHLVVIIDGEGMAGAQQLESPNPQVPLAALGVHVVSLVDSPHDGPEGVDVRIDIAGETALMSGRDLPFLLDLPAPGVPAAIARTLSAMRLTTETGGDDGLTDTVGLPEILGVADPARLELRRTWQPRPLRELLRVPIGIGSDGRTVELDLKESAHGGMGPHGLVVGATGSGKSEMLRTLVSSLVIGHGPDRLALMLVDFKGGATFAAMEHIPHIAGVITNLQDDLTLVDRMRDALYGEMQRRQEVLKAAGNLPNVTVYQDRIDAGEDLEPLPHLLVIVDEFSELLTAKPDFAELFVAIGRIGRSIGVHLLLASQKLEMGKIRGLESHLSYRIGLRTFSEGESRDAIGVPDAYHLPPEPGSGYLKVDTTVFERFKAALVSSPYVPPSGDIKTSVPVVPYLAVNGVGAWIAQQALDEAAEEREAVESAAETDRTVLDVICHQMEVSGRPRVRPVWLDPMPSHLPLGDLVDLDETATQATCTAVIGTVDDPTHQAQYDLTLDFTGWAANLVVSGSPQTGKSTLLRTMMLSMGAAYAPGDVAFYCVDYGGGSLSALQDLPHVASVATRVDPERIVRTVNDVATTLNRREEMFRERGIDSVETFRRLRAQGELPDADLGDVFLIVDGWGTFRDEYDDFDFVISDIAARGTNFGVHVILTVTQAMQVRMRMQAAMSGKLELRLNDTYDSEFDRQTVEKVPKDVPGRGITGTRKEAKLFQAAFPFLELPDGEIVTDEDRSSGQARLIERIQQKWGDRSVPKVRVLPHVVPYDAMPATQPGSPDIFVGLSERDLGPAPINLLGSDPHLQVYGDGETGKTNLLKLIIENLTTAHSPDDVSITLVDFRRTLLDVVPDDYLLRYLTTVEQVSDFAGEMATAIRQRMPGPDVTAEQLRNRSWWDGMEVFVIVDDYDLVATSQGDPLLPFVELLAQGRDLGFHLILSRRIGGLSRAIFEPMIQRMVDLSVPGFMFSGDRMEGPLVGGHPARRLPKGRAMYVDRDGKVSLIQTAQTSGGA